MYNTHQNREAQPPNRVSSNARMRSPFHPLSHRRSSSRQRFLADRRIGRSTHPRAECAVRRAADPPAPCARSPTPRSAAISKLCDADKPLLRQNLLPAPAAAHGARRASASCWPLSVTTRAPSRRYRRTYARRQRRERCRHDRFRRSSRGVTEADCRPLSASTANWARTTRSPPSSASAERADPHHTRRHAAASVTGPFDVVAASILLRHDRTFVFASPAKTARGARHRAARERAAPSCSSRVRFCDIDAAARSIIEEALRSYFTHRLTPIASTARPARSPARRAVQAACVLHRAASTCPRVRVRIETSCWSPKRCEVLNSYPRDCSIASARSHRVSPTRMRRFV